MIVTEYQYVSKRRKLPRSRSIYKSASYGSDFMSQFKQKPVQQKKKKTVKPIQQNSGQKTVYRKKKPLLNFNFPDLTLLRKSKKNNGKKAEVQADALTTIVVVLITVIFSLAVLNWKDITINTDDFNNLKLPDSAGADEQTIIYATNKPQKGQTSALVEETGDAAALHPAQDNHHGELPIFEWRQYKVQSSDTVSGIAQKYEVSVGAIIASNNIPNARRLQAGTVLKIPSVDGIPHQVKSGDTLLKIAVSYNIPLDVILDINDIKSDNIKPGETIFIPGARMNDIDLRLSLGETFMYPLHRKHITSRFGIRKSPFTGALQFHDGVDFRADIGTTVMASMDGTVEVVGENWLYGKYIIIKHSNGYKTLYGHLNSYNVKKGEKVIRGRKIAESGNTGNSTGPHLHFGAYDKNGAKVNPLELLK